MHPGVRPGQAKTLADNLDKEVEIAFRPHLSRKLSPSQKGHPPSLAKWLITILAFFPGQITEYLFYSVTSNLCVSLGFTLIPGPIVVAMVICLMYSPFAPDG